MIEKIRNFSRPPSVGAEIIITEFSTFIVRAVPLRHILSVQTAEKHFVCYYHVVYVQSYTKSSFMRSIIVSVGC